MQRTQSHPPGERPDDCPSDVNGPHVVEQIELARGDVRLRGDVIGEGPPILLLHAGGERRSVWTPVSALLASAGYRCVTFDLRGHGESQGSRHEFWPMADDAGSMITSIERPCVVVGSSLGAMAAIGALSMDSVPSRVRGMVLVDVVPDPSPSFARRFLERQGVLARGSELVDDVLSHGAELARILGRFHRPLLLVRASDSAVTDSDVNRLRRRLPQTEVVDVDSGHLVAREAPSELARNLIRALGTWHHACPTARLDDEV